MTHPIYRRPQKLITNSNETRISSLSVTCTAYRHLYQQRDRILVRCLASILVWNVSLLWSEHLRYQYYVLILLDYRNAI